MKHIINQIKSNLGAGLTVALISFPLSISLAIAGGVSPFVGLIGGFWGGLLGAYFVKTKLSIVGVAASVITLQLAFVKTYPEFALTALSILTMTTGLILIIIKLLNLQEFIKFIPSYIITGFAAGVGLVICNSQTKSILGFNLLDSFNGAIQNLNMDLSLLDLSAFSLFLVSLLLMLGFEKITKKIPSAIFISILGIIYGFFVFDLGHNIKILKDKFSSLSDPINSAPELLKRIVNIPDFSSVSFSSGFISDLIITASLIAAIIVLESLITARFISNQTNQKGKASSDIFGMGLINFVVGFFGGMPVLNLISRTSANLQSGASSNYSVIMYAIFMALMTLILTPIIGFYPFPVIGAILIRVALPLVNIEDFKHLFNSNKSGFIIALIVAVLVVFQNAAVAVAVGSTLSLMELIRKLAQSEFKLELFKDGKEVYNYEGFVIEDNLPSADKSIYYIEGVLTYFNSQIHIDRLNKISKSGIKNIIIDLGYLFYIDYDGAQEIKKGIDELRADGFKIESINEHRNVSKVLKEI